MELYGIEGILNYNYDKLVNYLKFEAGLSHSVFGGTVGGIHNLNLQQVPEEFSKLLLFFKSLNNTSYLELGIGQGGSFLLNSLFQTNLKICHAVDNCEYQKIHTRFWDQTLLINNRISHIKKIKKINNVHFFNMPTDIFFKSCKNSYDIIFIDADHRYEGVKKDYINSLKVLNPNGYLIFHDIANEGQGVKKLWDELEPKLKVHEFINSHNCGIGVYKP